MIDGVWITSGVAVVGFGYLGYSMRSLAKDVRDVKDSLNRFKIQSAKEQGEMVTYPKCADLQAKCSSDMRSRIGEACRISKHHSHDEAGRVVLP
jgi:hypothetical protein